MQFSGFDFCDSKAYLIFKALRNGPEILEWNLK